MTHHIPNKEIIFLRHLYSKDQKRESFIRKQKKFSSKMLQKKCIESFKKIKKNILEKNEDSITDINIMEADFEEESQSSVNNDEKIYNLKNSELYSEINEINSDQNPENESQKVIKRLYTQKTTISTKDLNEKNDLTFLKSSFNDIDQIKNYKNYFNDSNIIDFIKKYKKKKNSIRKLSKKKFSTANNFSKVGYEFIDVEKTIKNLSPLKKNQKIYKIKHLKIFFQ